MTTPPGRERAGDGSRRAPGWLGAGLCTATGSSTGAVLACLAVVALLAPVLGAIVDAAIGLAGAIGAGADDAPRAGASPRVFDPGPAARGLLVAGAIATLATLLAMPAALATASRRWTWSLLAAPLLMPPYLAYSGWGVLRDPTWATGRWIVEAGLAADAPEWLAFAGLTLWSWPIAAAIVGASVRARDRAAGEALALEPVPAWRRVTLWLGEHRAAIVASWVAIGALMLGSAVPLHLAQFETGAIRVWLLIDQTLMDDRWRVWVAAWPMMLAAALASWILTGPLVRDRDGVAHSPDPGAEPGADTRANARPPTIAARRRAGVLNAAWAIALLAASIAVPLGLFALTLGRADALTRFLDRAGGALGTSVSIGVGLGVAGVLLGALTAWGAGARTRFGRILGVWTLRLSVFGALVPGVLVGEAWARTLAAPWPADLPLLGPLWDTLRDHPVSIALAIGARLAFLPVVAGWWIAQREGRHERDARSIDRADGPVGWWRAWGSRWGATLLGVGLGVAALSVHEIEATVQVQPPGVDVLARLVLDDLHFERPDQRSAAGLVLMLAALVPAIAASVVLWTRGSRLRRSVPKA